jgi:hypothetical protein
MEFQGTSSKEKWASHANNKDEYLYTLPKFIIIINLARPTWIMPSRDVG